MDNLKKYLSKLVVVDIICWIFLSGLVFTTIFLKIPLDIERIILILIAPLISILGWFLLGFGIYMSVKYYKTHFYETNYLKSLIIPLIHFLIIPLIFVILFSLYIYFTGDSKERFWSLFILIAYLIFGLVWLSICALINFGIKLKMKKD